MMWGKLPPHLVSDKCLSLIVVMRVKEELGGSTQIFLLLRIYMYIYIKGYKKKKKKIRTIGTG